MNKKVYIPIILMMLCLNMTLKGQTAIGGSVKDLLGKPIEGTTVFHNRVVKAIETDVHGFFYLQGLMEGDTILFSHILYRDTVVVFNRRMEFLSLILNRENHTLSEVEVVSTGYQSIPKERSTGSFSLIENKRITEQVNFNIMDRISSVASGVVFDRNTKSGSMGQLMVRGMSTILGETQPLIVLDNFPYEGDLASINPDDVQNITVLRDAAAASIWGAQAGNGVIVITSKKSKYNQKLQVSISSITSIQAKPDLFSVDRIKSSDMIDVERILFDKGYHNSLINSQSKPVLSPAVELFIQRSSTSDSKVLADIDMELDRLRDQDVRNDFIKYIYRPGLQQQSTLGLAQGSENFVWNASFGNAIMIDNLDFETKRNTILVNSRMNIDKNLIFDGGINVSFLGTESGRPGYGNISAYNGGLFPYAELVGSEGNALPVYKDWRAPYLSNEVSPSLLDWKYYPLEDYKHSNLIQRNQNMLLSAGLEYSLPRWLKLSVKYQFQKQSGISENLRDVDSYEARNLVNGYAQENDNTGGVDFKIPKGAILDRANSDLQAHNLRGQLDFDWNTDFHKISAILGTEVRSLSTNSQSNRLYGYNPNSLSYSIFDLTVPYRHYITGASTIIPSGLALNQRQGRYISTFFNGSYTFLDRYTATFSGRRDASNLFGLNVKDKWNPFWSAGIGWAVSKESFWGKNPLEFLKLRATYGKTGNVNPAMVALTTIQYVGPNPYTQTPYARFDNYANPELRWETVGMTNIGIDFAMWNNRISGTVEGYMKKGTNLYGIAPMDYTTGVDAFIVKNVASMSSRGLDVTLNTINTTGNIRWVSNLNFSMNSDKITKYNMESDIASQFVTSINRISGRVGSPVYSMYSYKWMGLDDTDGAPLGSLNEEASREYRQFTGANATVDDLIYHGSILPRLFGSVGNTVSWKDWSVTFRMTFKFDYNFRRETVRYSSLFSAWNGHGDYNKRWQKPGDEVYTDIPAMIYPIPSGAENFYPYAEPFVERGDHIRLEYVNLSYQLPRASQTRWFKDASVTFNMNNLGLIYKRNTAGIDPDYSSASSTGFPPPTIYSLSIKCAL